MEALLPTITLQSHPEGSNALVESQQVESPGHWDYISGVWSSSKLVSWHPCRRYPARFDVLLLEYKYLFTVLVVCNKSSSWIAALNFLIESPACSFNLHLNLSSILKQPVETMCLDTDKIFNISCSPHELSSHLSTKSQSHKKHSSARFWWQQSLEPSEQWKCLLKAHILYFNSSLLVSGAASINITHTCGLDVSSPDVWSGHCDPSVLGTGTATCHL